MTDDRIPERTEMHMRHRSLFTTRLVFGLLLVALGILWTLDNLQLIDASQLTRFWPAVLVLYGIARMLGASGRRAVFSGTLFISAGVWLLLHELGLVPWSLLQIWPVLLVVLGIGIILRTSRQRTPPMHDQDDASPHPRMSVVLGGAHRRVHTQGLVGAEVTAVLGNAQLDLREARTTERSVVVDVVAVCGGVEILVPRGWKVSCEIVPVMGAVEDQTLPVEGDAAVVLVVRGALVMGGCELRSEPDDRHRRHARHGRGPVRRG